MPLGFTVFNGESFYDAVTRTSYVFCVRCEAWIPFEVAYGQAIDPHIYDHRRAYYMLRSIDGRPR